MSLDSKRGDRGRLESVEKTNKYLKSKKLGGVKDWYHPDKNMSTDFGLFGKNQKLKINSETGKQLDQGCSESVESCGLFLLINLHTPT